MASKKRTQACTVCGYPRKFVRMREKIGKDGRLARWPEFEICPYKDDPTRHPVKRTKIARLDAELRDPSLIKTVEEVRERQKRPAGILYQVIDINDPLGEVANCLLHFEEKVGNLPMAIGVRKDEAGEFTEIDWETEDGEEVTIPIWPMKLSARYGYLYLVKELA